MNLKSTVTSDERPTLQLNHPQVYRGFVTKDGKETSPVEKSLDTPLQSGEIEGADFIPQPKVRSRRFPIKCMFLGSIDRPRPKYGFDGKILLKRISEKWKVTRETSNQKFSDDAFINSEIKDGEWKSLHVDGMTCGELTMFFEKYYDLDEFIGDRLEITRSISVRWWNLEELFLW